MVESFPSYEAAKVLGVNGWKPVTNSKGLFSRGLAPLHVVRELSNIKEFSPIKMISTLIRSFEDESLPSFIKIF